MPKTHRIVQGCAVLSAALLAVVPLPPAAVERGYSERVYPAIQRALTATSNTVPFALFDLVVAAAAAWWLVRLVGDIRSARRVGVGPAGMAIVMRTATVAAVAYLAFLATWGLNYRRVPVADKVAFDASRVSRS